jgi:DNA-directed RNA polymerase specialized sigma24 family protein
MPKKTDNAFSWKEVETALEECRRMARSLLRREQEQYSWRPTALLDEALRRMYPKGQWQEVTWNNRRHFLNTCRKAMKSAIADRHRLASAAKRPPEVSLDLVHDALSSSNPDLVTDYGLYWAFSQATSRISQTDPQLAEILELRFLVGLSVFEAAALLDYSDRHMRRLWAEAVQKLEDVVKTQ